MVAKTGSASPKERQELQQIAFQAQAFQAQNQTMQSQLNSLQSTIVEIRATIEALKNLEGVKDKEILLPVGSGVLMNARFSGSDKVLVEIGSGVIAEKNFPETRAFLEKRLKEVEDVRDKVQDSITQLSGRLQDLDVRAQTILKDLKQGEA